MNIFGPILNRLIINISTPFNNLFNFYNKFICIYISSNKVASYEPYILFGFRADFNEDS